jgi:tetratricopeptide (TPR) repeat protein
MYELAPDDLDAIMELSYATNSLGSLAMELQQFDMARKNFEESLRLKLLAQFKDSTNNRLQADIANARSWLASAAQALGDISSAIDIHKQLQSELEQSEIVKEPYALHRLTASYQILADLLGYQSKNAEALGVSERSFNAISKAIEQDPKNASWQRRKYYYYFQSFKFLSDLLEAEVERKLKALIDTMETEQSLLSDVNQQEFSARYRLIAAEQLQTIKMFTASQEYADQAYDSFNQLTEQYPQNISYIALLSDSQLLQAKALMAAGQHDTAISLCQQVQERMVVITTNNKDPRYSIGYAKALDCQGKLGTQPTLITTLRQNGVAGFAF